MSSHVEKLDFSERLLEALAAAGLETESPTVLARRFNLLHGGEPVSAQAVRKWLQGESIPAQERLLVLARWLRVSPQWLRFGEQPASVPAVREQKARDYNAADLAELVQLLNEEERAFVARIVLSLLRE